MKIQSILLLLLSWHVINAQQSYPITFTHDGKTVYGTFLTPEGTGRFPTIIINPGSGPNDRDGTLLLSGGNVPCLYPDLNGETLTPYKELAEALVDSGFAVLRYDKLEFTYSAASLIPITFHKLWLPVESAIAYVKTRSDVDTNRLILIGHSEGSSLIPYIAKGRSDIKALISIAGARTPFDSILAYQLVHFARICDGDTIAAKMQADQILQYFGLIRDGFCNSLPPFEVSACVWRDYLDATDPVAENYNLTNLPTLFIGLGLDINVPPAELTRFQNEVTITDDFWSVPGLIHYMTPNDDPHVSITLTDTIIYWLRENNFITDIDGPSPEDEPFMIYPNPFRDKILIDVPTNSNNATLSLYSATGQLISSWKHTYFSHTPVDMSFLDSGVYLLELITDRQKIAKKIIKA